MLLFFERVCLLKFPVNVLLRERASAKNAQMAINENYDDLMEIYRVVHHINLEQCPTPTQPNTKMKFNFSPR